MISTYLPIIIPFVVASAGLCVAVLKHYQHALLAEMLEEAMVLEHEYEDGVPLADLLAQAAKSQAAKDTLAEITQRVQARKDASA